MVASAFRDHRSARRLGFPGLLLVLVLGVLACGGKSPAQLAKDALDAGLQAHIAGDLDKATAKYQECLKQEATNQFCLFNMGVIAQAQGRMAEAQNLYQLALMVDPVFGSALFNLAIVMTPQSPDEAVVLYRRFVEVAPDDANGRLNFGLLLRSTGDAAGAEEQFAQARQLNPAIVIPEAIVASPSP